MDGLSEQKWLLILAACAVLIRLPWVVAMSERSPLLDEVAYVSHAEKLCAGQGYVDARGARSSFWPVGYPAVLALAYCSFGVSAGVGVGLQIVLLTLTAVLLSVIGERSFGPRIGRTGALLLAAYPNHVFYTTLLLSEPLCTLLLLAMTALLLRCQRQGKGLFVHALGAGVLAGLAALVRPSFLLLPALLPWWGRMQKMSWSRTLLLTATVALTALLTMAPWMMRNHEVTGGLFEVASNGGFVFWSGNHPQAFGGVVRPPSIATDLRVGTADYDDSLGYRLGLESMLSDIPATLRRSLQKLTYFFALETDGAMWNLKGLDGAGRGVLPVLIASLAYIAAMASGMFALLHGLRNRPFGAWFLLLGAYSLAMAVAFEADPRYHFHLIPFLLMYSAVWLRTYTPELAKINRREVSSYLKPPKSLGWSLAMAILVLLLVANLWLKHLEGRW